MQGQPQAPGLLVRIRDTLWARVSSGNLWTLGMFIVLGLMIYIFLFLTVHNRNSALYADKHIEWTRYRSIINTWIQEGPLKYGNLRLIAPYEKKWTSSWGAMDESRQYFYGAPMTFLRAAYLLQLVNYKLRGNYSQTLMAMHNQAIIMLSGSLLGYLAFLIGLRQGIAPFSSLTTAATVQMVWQTFPCNLMTYWETNGLAVFWIFALIFLIIFFRQYHEGRNQKNLVLQGITVFFMVCCDYISAAFFLFSYFLVLIFMVRENLREQAPIYTIVAPFILGLGLILIQPLVLRVIYPEINLVGSSFMMRTGLNGDVQFVRDHWSIVYSPSRIFGWGSLLVGGAISTCLMLGAFLKDHNLKPQIVILFTGIAFYCLAAFVFSQSFAIHPYYVDVILALPIMLSLFVLCPIQLEKWSNGTGVFTLIFLLVAICYSWVQLRSYAINYPV